MTEKDLATGKKEGGGKKGRRIEKGYKPNEAPKDPKPPKGPSGVPKKDD